MQYTTVRSGDTALRVSRMCLGTMRMGTQTDEETSVAILDRFAEAGGTFLDTANNYDAWNLGVGRESEELLGRWLKSRGVRDDVVIATKCGAHKRDPDLPLSAANFQGLGPAVVRREADLSRAALGVDRLDVLYGHVDDRETPLDEVAGVFGELAAAGTIGVPGLSNVSAWRLAQARDSARARRLPAFGVVQNQGTYCYPRPVDLHGTYVRQVNPELLDYADSQDDLTVLAYSPLMAGAYVRPDRVPEEMDHPGNRRRIAVATEVAGELGATVNQVVLAWLMTGPVPVIPIFGAGSLGQLEESLGAADLDLPGELRARLDAA